MQRALPETSMCSVGCVVFVLCLNMCATKKRKNYRSMLTLDVRCIEIERQTPKTLHWFFFSSASECDSVEQDWKNNKVWKKKKKSHGVSLPCLYEVSFPSHWKQIVAFESRFMFLTFQMNWSCMIMYRVSKHYRQVFGNRLQMQTSQTFLPWKTSNLILLLSQNFLLFLIKLNCTV